MPEKPNDGGPAFPRAGAVPGTDMPGDDSQEGMTLRDYFAAAALTGLLGTGTFPEPRSRWDSMVRTAYDFADAMIQERKECDA